MSQARVILASTQCGAVRLTSKRNLTAIKSLKLLSDIITYYVLYTHYPSSVLYNTVLYCTVGWVDTCALLFHPLKESNQKK